MHHFVTRPLWRTSSEPVECGQTSAKPQQLNEQHSHGCPTSTNQPEVQALPSQRMPSEIRVGRSSSSCSSSAVVGRRFPGCRRVPSTAIGENFNPVVTSTDRLQMSGKASAAASEKIDTYVYDIVTLGDVTLSDAQPQSAGSTSTSPVSDGCSTSTLLTSRVATFPSNQHPSDSYLGSSGAICRRKTGVLRVPFDENNVPQIDRALTPTPPPLTAPR
jgi:hypothetical protein